MAFYSDMTPEQRDALSAFILQTLPQQVEELSKLVRIPSVKGAPEGKYPFGAPIQHALDAALALAEKLGFPGGRDLDGYAGVIDSGNGKETLGILAHLDVVPAGDGWTSPPFSAALRDGRVYGRGAIDDKGPAVSSLYALAAVRAAGIPLKKRVRLIFGCDEESGWACMDRYHKTEPMPDVAFSPDGEYPLVYSEKAILRATFFAPLADTGVRIRAGERANVVPGLAEATVPGKSGKLLAGSGFYIHAVEEGNATKYIVTGLGAHASTPENGKNALQWLVKALSALPLPEPDAGAIRALSDAFGMDMHGETLGLDITDESGRLTLNPGVLVRDETGLRLTIDSRVPHSLTTGDVLRRVAEALAPAGFTVETENVTKGLLVKRESPLVQKLLGVYRAQTGDMREPLAIGGGTYARAMDNAVAFGCEWPGDPMLAHMPDEYISLEDIRRNTELIADAIVALAN